MSRRLYMFYNKSKLWTQPILTENGTLGGTEFAVYSNIINYSCSEPYPYYCFDFDLAANTLFHSNSGATNGYIIMYNPTPIRITNFKIVNQSSYGSRSTKTGNIYGSNTNGDWNLLTTINRSSGPNSDWNIDLSSNTNYYKYYKYENLSTFSSFWVINQIYITAYEE